MDNIVNVSIYLTWTTLKQKHFTLVLPDEPRAQYLSVATSEIFWSVAAQPKAMSANPAYLVIAQPWLLTGQKKGQA